MSSEGLIEKNTTIPTTTPSTTTPSNTQTTVKTVVTTTTIKIEEKKPTGNITAKQYNNLLI